MRAASAAGAPSGGLAPLIAELERAGMLEGLLYLPNNLGQRAASGVPIP